MPGGPVATAQRPLAMAPVAKARAPLAMAPVAKARAPVAKAPALRSGDQKRAPLPIVIVYVAGQHVVPP